MKVTVLLTIYNRPEYLPEAIDSVLNQTYSDWELLLLDDGSDDPEVGEILTFYVKRDSRIRAIRFPTTDEDRKLTVRYASAVNWGVEHSTGELITYLCHDDWYLPSRLERMARKVGEGYAVVYGPQVCADASGKLIDKRHLASEPLINAHSLVDMNSVMHTREAFVRADGWPTEPSPIAWRQADGQFWNRLTDLGYVFQPVDGVEPTDVKRYHDDSIDIKVRKGLNPWSRSS